MFQHTAKKELLAGFFCQKEVVSELKVMCQMSDAVAFDNILLLMSVNKHKLNVLRSDFFFLRCVFTS